MWAFCSGVKSALMSGFFQSIKVPLVTTWDPPFSCTPPHCSQSVDPGTTQGLRRSTITDYAYVLHEREELRIYSTCYLDISGVYPFSHRFQALV